MRRATVETEHDEPERVARALRPDNTDDVRTEAVPEEGVVRTSVERETTGGLAATVDDYVVNLTVAETIIDTTHNE